MKKSILESADVAIRINSLFTVDNEDNSKECFFDEKYGDNKEPGAM